MIAATHQQLAAEIPAGPSARCLALSASKEIEPGARAMLLLAEGLFRLDLVISDDTIRTIVRNLSSGELHMQQGPGGAAPSAVASREAAAYRPGHSRIEFALGEGADGVRVKVLIGIVRFADRGTVRATAQAIVRHPSAAESVDPHVGHATGT